MPTRPGRVLLSARAASNGRPGTLVLTATAATWTAPDVPDPVSVPWTDVLSHQINAARSAKAMLRLNLTASGAPVVFQVTEGAREAARAKLEEIRDEITRLLRASGPSAARAAAAAAAGGGTQRVGTRIVAADAGGAGAAAPRTKDGIRRALLDADPALREQYSQVVESGIVSAADFWSSRSELVAQEATRHQRRGMPTALLTDIRGERDETGRVQFVLTPERIQQIFVHYPLVREVYEAQVPDKMNEQEFWRAYFKSRFFHRDRADGARAGAAVQADVFDEAEAEAERKRKRQAAATGAAGGKPRDVHPSVDLTATTADLGARVWREEPGGGAEPSGVVAKYNRHAELVLEDPLVPRTKRPRVQDSVEAAVALPDLQAEDAARRAVPLRIQDPKRYFGEPSAAAVGGGGSRAALALPAELSLDGAFGRGDAARAALADVLARAAVAERAARDRAAGSSATPAGLPAAFVTDLSRRFSIAQELQRHYWARAELRGPQATAKRAALAAQLNEQYAALQQLRTALRDQDMRAFFAAIGAPDGTQVSGKAISVMMQMVLQVTRPMDAVFEREG